MRLFALILTIALFGLAAAPAAAEGGLNYNAEALIFIQEDLPEGWVLIDPEDELPAGLPTEDQLTELAGESAFDLMVEYRLVERSGTKAVVAMIDVDSEGGPATYRKAVDQVASASGWTVTELGSPTRLLIVAGQPDDVQTLTRWQVELAAQTLGEMAYHRILKDHAYGKPGGISRERAEEYTEAAEKLVPGTGAVAVFRGMFHLYDEEYDEAYQALGKATKAKAAIPAPPGLVAFALTMQARSMLERKRADLDEEVVDVLKRANEMKQVLFDEASRLEKDGLRRLPFENLYNLGCAYARQKKNDTALAQISEAMDLAKLLLDEKEYANQFRYVWFWDEDLEELRKDPKFEAFAKKYAPKDFDFAEELEKAKKEKARRDKAKADQEAANKKAEKEKEKGKEKEPAGS